MFKKCAKVRQRGYFLLKMWSVVKRGCTTDSRIHWPHPGKAHDERRRDTPGSYERHQPLWGPRQREQEGDAGAPCHRLTATLYRDGGAGFNRRSRAVTATQTGTVTERKKKNLTLCRFYRSVKWRVRELFSAPIIGQLHIEKLPLSDSPGLRVGFHYRTNTQLLWFLPYLCSHVNESVCQFF